MSKSNVARGRQSDCKSELYQRIVGVVLFIGFTLAAVAAVSAQPSSNSLEDRPQKYAGPMTSTPGASRTPSASLPSPSAKQLASRWAAQMRMPGQPVVDANTVALYHLDASNGSNALDATGRYTGTLYGNAVITTTGLYDGVLLLDGRDGPGSYLRTGNLGPLSSGTIETFVDFETACLNADEHWGIFSAGGEFGSYQQPSLWLGDDGYLRFWMFVDNKYYMADSTINPCRYFNGKDQSVNFGLWGLPVLWPYETGRFHHVAATWGPRGMEIWVDGVLHGVGLYVPDLNNLPTHGDFSCSPQQQEQSIYYPDCQFPSMGLVNSSYGGGLPAYSTFLIGCDPSKTCLKGRVDEIRISNIQRTFSWSLVPTVTPTPTQTPDHIAGEYPVDSATLSLYHLNAMNGQVSSQNAHVFNQVSQLWDANVVGNAFITSPGHYNGALALDGNGSYAIGPNFGSPVSGAIEAWVKLQKTSSLFGIVTAGSDPSGTYHWANIFLGQDNLAQPTLRFGISDGTNWHEIDSGVPTSSLIGCWHHVAGTWGLRGMEIWIDGVLRSTGSFAGRPQNYDPTIIGCDHVGRCLSGQMDEVRASNLQRSYAPPLYSPQPRVPSASDNFTFLPLIFNHSGCQYP